MMLEDEMPKKYKNVLSSLPKESGWDSTYLYQDQGFWLTNVHFMNALAGQQRFQAQPTDIVLSSHPKYGSTWLKSLAFTIQDRMRYPPTHSQHPLLINNPHELVLYLDHDFNFDKEMSAEDPSNYSSTCPRLYATHFPYVSLPNSVKH